MNSEDACVICGKRDQLFRCGQCRAVLYCSKEHQKNHWRYHKTSCIFNSVSIAPNHPVGGGGDTAACHIAGQVVTPPDVRGICQSRDESPPVNNCFKTHETTLSLATLSLGADTSAVSYRSPDETMPSLNSASPRSPLSVGSVLQQHITKNTSVLGDLSGEYQQPFKHNSLLEKTCEDPMKRHTAEWILQVCQFVVNDLDKYGICVVDNFLGKERGEILVKTVESMYDSGVFQEGEVVSTKVKTSRNIRGDKITWVDGTEAGTAAISFLISMVDSVVMHAKRMKLGKLSQYDISGRTKAMVACYPGHGTHYVKHVDNPNRDGRCITSIYYLNKDWDIKTDGGLLRIFPEGWTNQVADIEPVFDRMLFFWSDRRNPHEVQPAYRTRYAITLWYFDAKEREDARLRHQRESKKTTPDEPKK